MYESERTAQVVKEGRCLKHEEAPLPKPSLLDIWGCCGPSEPPSEVDGQWVQAYIVLCKPATLSIYNNSAKKLQVMEINLSEVKKSIYYGRFSRELPSRPTPPFGPEGEEDDFRVLAIPETRFYNGTIHWLALETDEEFDSWLSAICDVLNVPIIENLELSRYSDFSNTEASRRLTSSTEYTTQLDSAYDAKISVFRDSHLSVRPKEYRKASKRSRGTSLNGHRNQSEHETDVSSLQLNHYKAVSRSRK